LCRRLVDMANERGGHDNVTVAVLTTSDAATSGAQSSPTLAEPLAQQSTPPDAAPSSQAGSAPGETGATVPVQATSAVPQIQSRHR
ncbi:MAG TPA: hypothetical protein VKB76_00290, partial [Ktedonobacterales bacterium]|nr:hypothetical protein [Ktedonobacterales bacterium]